MTTVEKIIRKLQRLRRRRGFEVVKENFKKESENAILPVRADRCSAGYDFSSPVTVTIKPSEQVLIWTNIKAYMKSDEVLKLYVRSSIGIKKGLVLANTVGIIDASYYENLDNDGNIGVCLKNTSDREITIEAGERIAQGVFVKYLEADDDVCLKKTRTGGIGSSNNK